MLETKFEQVLRICLMDKLFEFLPIQEFSEELEHVDRYCFMSYDHDEDLLELMKCNKKIKTMTVEKLMKKIYFFSSTLRDWKNPSKITRLVINEDVTISESMLPLNLTHLKFDFYFNQPIDSNLFDQLPFLEYLEFGYQFNQPINISSCCVKYLHISNIHNGSLKPGMLPANLESLKISNLSKKLAIEPGALPLTLKDFRIYHCDQPFSDGVFSPELQLEQITIGGYDFPLNVSMLRSLKCLTFTSSNFDVWGNHKSFNFNQPLLKNSLPENLTKLVLSDSWNHPLEPNVLPKNLTHLVFGKSFNQDLGSCFVHLLSLSDLSFGGSFNRPLNPSELPEKLKCLTLGNNYYHDNLYDHVIKINVLPKTLIKFTFNHYYRKNQFELNALPPNLEDLTFTRGVETDSFKPNFFPQSLKNLCIWGSYNGVFDKDVLPPNLNHLDVWKDFNQYIEHGSLPQNLVSLGLSEEFNQPIAKNVLPQSLQKLEFSHRSKFNQLLEKDVLPQGLLKLEFGEEFNQPIEKDVLPQGLLELKFGGNFNQPIKKDVLPQGLLKLKFGGNFNQPIEEDSLPSNLRYLSFGWDFNQPLEIDLLPKKLEILKFNNRYHDDPKYQHLSHLFTHD